MTYANCIWFGYSVQKCKNFNFIKLNVFRISKERYMISFLIVISVLFLAFLVFSVYNLVFKWQSRRRDIAQRRALGLSLTDLEYRWRCPRPVVLLLGSLPATIFPANTLYRFRSSRMDPVLRNLLKIWARISKNCSKKRNKFM